MQNLQLLSSMIDVSDIIDINNNQTQAINTLNAVDVSHNASLITLNTNVATNTSNISSLQQNKLRAYRYSYNDTSTPQSRVVFNSQPLATLVNLGKTPLNLDANDLNIFQSSEFELNMGYILMIVSPTNDKTKRTIVRLTSVNNITSWDYSCNCSFVSSNTTHSDMDSVLVSFVFDKTKTEQHDAQLISLDSQITTVNTNITSLQSQVSTANTNITSLQTGKMNSMSSGASGNVMLYSTTTSMSSLTGVATGNALLSGGVGANPSWGKVDIATHTSGNVPVNRGGTNLTAAPTNGQLLIGNGTGYTLATITGTTNSVSVTNAAGAITLSLPMPTVTSFTQKFDFYTNTGSDTIITATNAPASGGTYEILFGGWVRVNYSIRHAFGTLTGAVLSQSLSLNLPFMLDTSGAFFNTYQNDLLGGLWGTTTSFGGTRVSNVTTNGRVNAAQIVDVFAGYNPSAGGWNAINGTMCNGRTIEIFGTCIYRAALPLTVTTI